MDPETYDPFDKNPNPFDDSPFDDDPFDQNPNPLSSDAFPPIAQDLGKQAPFSPQNNSNDPLGIQWLLTDVDIAQQPNAQQQNVDITQQPIAQQPPVPEQQYKSGILNKFLYFPRIITFKYHNHNRNNISKLCIILNFLVAFATNIIILTQYTKNWSNDFSCEIYTYLSVSMIFNFLLTICVIYRSARNFPLFFDKWASISVTLYILVNLWLLLPTFLIFFNRGACMSETIYKITYINAWVSIFVIPFILIWFILVWKAKFVAFYVNNRSNHVSI